ncbi:MAG: 4-hydroxythreonine-4-phosphate dehydrogenase PdxA [Candidatus Zixiibacteriota bacterium]|nr:MAG: 4-hydroxythreonine-4-phosphate dehydrogenase PdxA [candidate division Zixibacteria bacterium]
MSSKPIVGITMGDPAGIGPEVVVKAVADRRTARSCHPIVLGSYHVIFSAARKFLRPTTVRRIVWPEDTTASRDGISVLHCSGFDQGRIKAGIVTKLSGRMAADSVFCAVQLALSGQIDAVVTAPLSKRGLRLAGYDFPGHTELLAYLTAAPNYAMMFVSKHHKVVLVTTHLPLAEVARKVSRKMIVDKLAVTQTALKKHFGLKRPRIGVCALNPHCGEEGILGGEEKRIIIPAIKTARRKRIRADGPFPSDTIFSPGISRDLDCILAMYHDQGLIPLKMRGFGEAVNVTIGLPIIRTSPDFGTALDIAGKGVADPKGMTNAILLAARMARRAGKR